VPHRRTAERRPQNLFKSSFDRIGKKVSDYVKSAAFIQKERPGATQTPVFIDQCGGAIVLKP
jgi:hypothetical protein